MKRSRKEVAYRRTPAKREHGRFPPSAYRSIHYSVFTSERRLTGCTPGLLGSIQDWLKYNIPGE